MVVKYKHEFWFQKPRSKKGLSSMWSRGLLNFWGLSIVKIEDVTINHMGI